MVPVAHQDYFQECAPTQASPSLKNQEVWVEANVASGGDM
jgi:hypothetical protein